jgi:hypothetical protein
MDLEGIDVLADNRIAVLSEQLHCLISESYLGSNIYTVVAEYTNEFTEFGHRGLEGLAIRNLGDGISRIAVLWEGGYTLKRDIPLPLRERIGSCWSPPVLIIHDLKKNELAGRIVQPNQYLVLDVPIPPGEEPNAQRFRATDLVWHKWTNNKTHKKEYGFIVLLSSENAPPSNDTPKRYKLKLLQRFNSQGDLVGKPLDINLYAREVIHRYSTELINAFSEKRAKHFQEIITLLEENKWENVNWEGLGWYEKGEAVITIYDNVPKEPPFALIIPLPPEWKI